MPKPLVLNSFSKTKAEAIADLFVQTGTWVVPTLTELRGDTFDGTTLNNPALQFMESGWMGEWRAHLGVMRDRQFETRWFEKHREVLKIFESRGVRILAGSDVPAPFCVPGYSLHDELARTKKRADASK